MDPQQCSKLQDVYTVGLNAGANTIMLLSDDYLPHTGKSRYHYSLYTLEDKDHFVNLQNAQAHLINKLKQLNLDWKWFH